MRRRHLFRDASKGEEVNLSPLIDVLFILLIFFIVTAVFTKETSVEIDRPKALSSTEVDVRAISLSVTAEGRVFYKEREVGYRGVRSVVRRELTRKQRPVVVLVDRRAEVQYYTRVHDEAALAGATAISMATQL